ncbi:diguanylate cyclase [Candidatus Aerophobetes bacterium]|nr:diguanylate cyclase [Candidatus Aerophobetes bacterium]
MEEKDFTLIKRELVEALFIIGEEREFFELVCKHLAGITGAEACCVFLLAEDGNFKFTAGYNFPEEKSLQLLASVEKDFTEKEKIVLDKEKLGFPSIVYFSFFSGKKPLGFSVLCSKKEHFNPSRELLFKLGEDVTFLLEKIRFIHNLREKSIRDGLTGLFARGYFIARLREEISRAERKGEKVCLLFCDIDDFKAINRTLGYSEGDRVLCRLSHLIGSCLRKEDLVCRYGGDEFAVLLPSTDHSGAREVAKRILAEIKAQTTRGEFLPSLSIGVVCYPDDANSLEDIMVKADISAIFAKHCPEEKIITWGNWESIQEKKFSSREIIPEVIYALAEVADEKNSYVSSHSKLLSQEAVSLARKMGLDEERARKTEMVALLHDIGNLAVPEYILNKPGSLTDKEWEIVRQHPLYSVQFLSKMRGLDDLAAPVRSVHERWDGKGYPNGISGEDIPIESRIVFVVCAFRAMLSERPYRKRLTRKQAVEELKSQAGKQFDPGVVRVFLNTLKEGLDGRLSQS